jgi:AcrR family transcriptional regulator
MALRQPVTLQRISDVAYAIVVTLGLEHLSMRNIATSLDIKAPSLYKHVPNREAIIALVQARGLNEFGDAFIAAGNTPREKAIAYREWAYSNPHLYYVVMREPLRRDLLPSGTEERVLAEVVKAAGGSHEKARAMWSLLHGLIDLELQGRYPAGADLDSTWEEAIALLG